LIGVGPGDPDLITLRAIEAIRKSDVIFCSPGIAQKFTEYLQGKTVHEGFWRLFPYYGADISKLEGQERAEAEAIAARRNQFIRMVRDAVAAGQTVAFLDNGDPMIYGPFSWTLEEFEDLKPKVIPGVSAFNAGNAALCKSVTVSSDTKSVILTAMDWPGKTDTIDKLSTLRCSMVIFTMRAEFEDLIRRLSVNWPPDTPVAIVKFAGYKDTEEVIQSTLGKVLDEVRGSDLPFEYMIYCGDFLKFRYKEAKVPPPH